MADEMVLVIEDNELNMKLAKSLLQIGKYRVLDARDAETGIEKAREHQPKLILMDIQLPGMDGLSATRIIKEDPTIKHIPVVALTSYAMQGDDQKAIGAGFDGYLTKPIDTRVFLKTISQFFVKDQSETQTQKRKMRHKARVLIVD
jgi:CheY-like chemotaxis protein